MAKGSASDCPSRLDIFAGASSLAPKGTVQVPQGNGGTTGYNYDAVNVGGLVSGAYYFNKFVGVQGEFGIHEWGDGYPPPRNVGTEGNDDGFLTLRWRSHLPLPLRQHPLPFAHAYWSAAPSRDRRAVSTKSGQVGTGSYGRRRYGL